MTDLAWRSPKRLVFIIAASVVVITAAELISFVGLSYLHGRLTLHGTVASQRKTRIVAPSLELPFSDLAVGGLGSGDYVIHPYLGFVQPDPYKARDKKEVSQSADYGFPQASPDIFISTRDTVVIGLFGGSFAHLFWPEGFDAVWAMIRSSPRFSGKSAVALNFAMGGYKQPQQLIALNYLLALGVRFDVVINIDGFNEVFLPPTTSIPMGVFPYFPRRWAGDVRPLDPDLRIQIGKLTYLREKRTRDASAFSNPPLSWSLTAGLWWTLMDRHTTNRITRCLLDLEALTAESLPYVAKGPSRKYTQESEMWNDFAEVWANCSRQMLYVCQGLGICYYHVLQPNQYSHPSKPMGVSERKIAFHPDSRFAAPVRKGYPYLRAMGRRLVEEGVPFFDMTQVFDGIESSVYADPCCHLNKKGNEILGTAIGRALIEDLQARSPRY